MQENGGGPFYLTNPVTSNENVLAPHFQVQHAFKKQLTKYFIAFQKKGPRWFKSFKRFFFLVTK